MTIHATPAAPIHQPATRPRTWEDDRFHYNRESSSKSVVVPPAVAYDGHMVFHTVWRNDAPKGYTNMKVESAEPIQTTRAPREPKINPFDAHIVAFAEAYSVTNEPGTGKSGRITLDDGDVLSTVVRNLRKAAAKISKTVILRYEDAKGQPASADNGNATGFRFQLKAKVAPKGSKTAEATTAAVVDAVVRSAKSGPNAAATKAQAKSKR